MNMASPASRQSLCTDLAKLGVAPGDLVMVHASLKAIGPVEGGAATIVDALCDAVGGEGTLMAYVSWDRSPYEETLNGRRLSDTKREAWPAFDPRNARPYPGFGALNRLILDRPGVRRSAHPDASMAAIGRDADWLIADHRPGCAFGPGSPLERLVQRRGKVLLLGAPPDTATVLHYAEAIADIPGKRRVTFEMPMLDARGRKVWVRAEEFDTNGILDCYAEPGSPDAVECIARAYLREGHQRSGPVGAADCHLFDAADLVAFGKAWLEARHGRDRPQGERNGPV